jgi:hypothetical protein
MSKDRDGIQRIQVELIPASRTAPAMQRALDAKAMLKKLVEQQVAEALANRDDLLFQPFLQSKRVSDELRRLQTVPEQRKWSVYHARYGCLVCESKKTGHASCGMCVLCRARTSERLKTCVKILGKHDPEWRNEYVDQEDLARRALKRRSASSKKAGADRKVRARMLAPHKKRGFSDRG